MKFNFLLDVILNYRRLFERTIFFLRVQQFKLEMFLFRALCFLIRKALPYTFLKLYFVVNLIWYFIIKKREFPIVLLFRQVFHKFLPFWASFFLKRKVYPNRSRDGFLNSPFLKLILVYITFIHALEGFRRYYFIDFFLSRSKIIVVNASYL